ncbi:bacillithiol biosynthesis cysteine-adding enzyme BshC [Pleomorphovibrio marinus]|uniref:bacillithiol biosynthesis cysteine-adding enzyme BshC n=1 Tax=Pleomorphovibrio marinus TaxID=2164132 RepID=UPI000E0B9500|nr:bacillithiol biosynthesis cysteine-adding enzyme BshC [Pleomorphovibrio marinus]
MIKSTVDPECTGQFSTLFLDYIRQKPQLKPFYYLFPSIENFGEAIKSRSFAQEKRERLVDVFRSQYQGLPERDKVIENIEAIGEPTTFTVTTGHQLNLMSGPLYFIYKIISTINLAKKLEEQYPEHHFVPVYWMATEDHDFAEINHFHFDGHKYEWKSEQTGPVGEFKIDEELRELLKKWQFLPGFIREAYRESPNLSFATRKFVDQLFGDEGLLILDANEPRLKKEFCAIMEADIFEQKANDLIQQQNRRLEELGYKSQVYPREVNFFYIQDGIRERIVKNGDGFEVFGRDEKRWTEQSLKDEIQNFPERFSPNVVMRPLYQECILPNLAYLGGPAEVAYWFQIKPVFDHYGLFFPIVMARNFVLVVPGSLQRKIRKIGLNSEDLFKPYTTLRKQWVIKEAKEDVLLAEESSKLRELYATLVAKSKRIDPTLEAAAEASGVNAQKILCHLSEKLRKAEEKKQQDLVRQLKEIKDVLFPGGVPQERKLNLLNFFLEDPKFVEQLFGHLDPLAMEMIVLYPNEG